MMDYKNIEVIADQIDKMVSESKKEDKILHALETGVRAFRSTPSNAFICTFAPETPENYINFIDRVSEISGAGIANTLKMVFYASKYTVHKMYSKKRVHQLRKAKKDKLSDYDKNVLKVTKNIRYYDENVNYKDLDGDDVMIMSLPVVSTQRKSFAHFTKAEEFIKFMGLLGFTLIDKTYVKNNFTQAWIVKKKDLERIRDIASYITIYNTTPTLRKNVFGVVNKTKNLSYKQFEKVIKKLEAQNIIFKADSYKDFFSYGCFLKDLPTEDELTQHLIKLEKTEKEIDQIMERITPVLQRQQDFSKAKTQKHGRWTTILNTTEKDVRNFVLKNYVSIDIDSAMPTIILQTISPFMSNESKLTIQIYTDNKEEIREKLAKIIARKLIEENFVYNSNELIPKLKKIIKSFFNAVAAYPAFVFNENIIEEKFYIEILKRALIDAINNFEYINKDFYSEKVSEYMKKFTQNKVKIDSIIDAINADQEIDSLLKQILLIGLYSAENKLKKITDVINNTINSIEFVYNYRCAFVESLKIINDKKIIKNGHRIESLADLYQSIESHIASRIYDTFQDAGISAVYIYDGFEIHKDDFKKLMDRKIFKRILRALEKEVLEVSFSVELNSYMSEDDKFELTHYIEDFKELNNKKKTSINIDQLLNLTE